MSEKKQIVAVPFYCIKTKKKWKKGQEYTGKRKDLAQMMEGYKAPAEKKAPAKK